MDLIQVELPPDQFATFIRQIKNADSERAAAYHAITRRAMRRLRLRHDPDAAVKGIPVGSDNSDVGSFVAWLNKVTRYDKAAKRQIVALHATVVARIGG